MQINNNAKQSGTNMSVFQATPTTMWPVVKTSICKPHSPLQNHLLSALSLHEYNRLLPHLELVPMPAGHLIYGSGERLKYVYFPTTAIVALMCNLESGATAQIAIVGNEGIVGVNSFMGCETTPSSAIAQNIGFGYRLKVLHLKNEINRAESLLNLLLRYTQALITQMAQTAVCNRHHSVEQHVSRLLLLSLDRSPKNSLALTQEMIASMLGVRREGVTEAAGNLQRGGMIKYSRGQIEVIDRPKLEKNVCECYAVVKSEFDCLQTHTLKNANSHGQH